MFTQQWLPPFDVCDTSPQKFVFSLFIFYIVFNIKLVKCHITRTVPPLDIIITEDIFDWLGQSLHFIFEERLLIGPRCMKGFVGAHSLLKSNHFLSVLYFDPNKKFLKIRQKLGTRNLIENLKNSLTLLISHSLSLNMLKFFSFHVYAQKSLFIAKNCNAFLGHWSSSSSPSPVSLRVHRAGSQLKMSESQTGAGNLKTLESLKL